MIDIKPTYTVTELAKMAGIHRDAMRRLLQKTEIEPIWNGRKMLIPVSEVVEKLGPILSSYKFVESLRKHAGA